MLNLKDSVYVACGGAVIDRGFVTRVHDDYVEILSLVSGLTFWCNRNRVVTAKKLTQSYGK